MEYDDRGYVVRCVDRDTGRVMFQGRKGKISHEKDAFRPDDTFTLRYAKSSLANIERLHPDVYFLSIERLSCYYWGYEERKPDRVEDMMQAIEHAMVRLDELWNGNDFDNGDKMRINEVRRVLNALKEDLLIFERIMDRVPLQHGLPV